MVRLDVRGHAFGSRKLFARTAHACYKYTDAASGADLVPRRMRRRRLVRFAVFAAIAILGLAVGASAAERQTVCSITINSDDEIRTLRRFLPDSEFRFVELTEHARAAAREGEPSWFGRACSSGVRCDVLVVSAHFGNTRAGNYGTTFAGSSGLSLSLDELERRRYDGSCPGVLADPLEVFLFACQTMSSRQGAPLPESDVALFASHHVSPVAAERVVDELRHGGRGTSNRERMEFVFAGVPRIYGFTDVAPAGKRVAPLLEKYLRDTGDYAAHLERSRRAGAGTGNRLIAKALEPTCFTQSSGLQVGGGEYGRNMRACALRDGKKPVAERLALVEGLLERPEFLTHLPAIHGLLGAAEPASLDVAASATVKRIANHAGGRAVVTDVLYRGGTPRLRFETLRLARAVDWISEAEAFPIRRAIVTRLLLPPTYGESRDLICALAASSPLRIEVTAEDVPQTAYQNEFAIEALGCLKPTDTRIHDRLGESLLDSREWIVRAAATALRRVRTATAGPK